MSIDVQINSSLGLLEAVEDSIEVLDDCITFIQNPTKLDIAKRNIKTLSDCFKVFSDSFNPIDLATNAFNLNSGRTSKIYQLGLAGLIIEGLEKGIGVDKVAHMYDIDRNTVRRFVRHYKSLTKANQAKVKASSVMNTTERLEELMTMCMRQLSRLEGTNDDVHVKYIAELRQTYQLAVQVAEKIATYNNYQRFRDEVTQILIDEIPERKHEIVRRLQGLQDESNSPLPARL